MDKYEFNLKIEQMRKLVNEEDFGTALKIAEGIEWERVRNTNLLTMAATVYEKNDRLDDARNILIMALERAPVGKRILFKLAELSVRSGEIDEAEDYYHEFHEIAPEDTGNYLLQYMLLKSKHAPYDKQLVPLERYCDADPDEKWLYELATSYEYAGRIEDSVRTCDRIALLYGDGVYSRKALRLKQRYAPLTEAQRNVLNPRTFSPEEVEAAEQRAAEPVQPEVPAYDDSLLSETQGDDQPDAKETLDKIQVAEEEYESYTAYTADMYRKSDELAAMRYEDEDAYFDAYVRAHASALEAGNVVEAEEVQPVEEEAPAEEETYVPAEEPEVSAPTLVVDLPEEEAPEAEEVEEAAPAAVAEPEEVMAEAAPEVAAEEPAYEAKETTAAPAAEPVEASAPKYTAPAEPVITKEAPAVRELKPALTHGMTVTAIPEGAADDEGLQMAFDFAGDEPIVITEPEPEPAAEEAAAAEEAPVQRTNVSAHSIEISTQQVNINVLTPPEIRTSEPVRVNEPKAPVYHAPVVKTPEPAETFKVTEPEEAVKPAEPVKAAEPVAYAAPSVDIAHEEPARPAEPAVATAPVRPAAPAFVQPEVPKAPVIPEAPQKPFMQAAPQTPAAPAVTAGAAAAATAAAATVASTAAAAASAVSAQPARPVIPEAEAPKPAASRPVPPKPAPQAKTSFTPKPAPAAEPVKPAPAPAAPKKEEAKPAGKFHMIIEAETVAEGLEIAIDELKAVHEENGIDHPSAKTTADKLNQKGLTDAILSKIRDKDFVIERAGDLDDDVIEDLYDLIRYDTSGTIVVLIDTPEGLDHVEDVRPELFDICDYISDIDDDEEDDGEDDYDEVEEPKERSVRESAPKQVKREEPEDDYDYDDEEPEDEPVPEPQPQKRSNGKVNPERFNNVKAVIPKSGDEQMEIDDFAQYCAQYASSIDCSITGKSMLALYERIELMEEDGIPLTRANAEQLIEEAADRAEKPPIGKRLSGMFRGKYDKNGLLILKEDDFIY